MLAAEQDDVSNIHRRWSFTRLTPGSLKSSYAMTLACATMVVAVSHIFHLQSSISELAVYLPLGLGVLFGTTLLDHLTLRGTAVKLSKVIHVSSFANLLWALTVIMGIAANAVFSKPAITTDYIIAGMMLAAGLRIGIYVSVFGSSLSRAVAIAFIQPVIFLFAFLPPSFYSVIASPMALAFGSAFVILGIVWTIIADKAGRPAVASTFKLLQAFLDAWTENKVDKIEEFFEGRAYESAVGTKIIRFSSEKQLCTVVLPDVHPGPFSMVGGSNLPYVLYDSFSKQALVMHSVSDHSLNIPSQREVDRYVSGLQRLSIQVKGDRCAEPVQIKKGNATVTGLAFDKSAMIMLSLAPKGMEDVPQSIRAQLESLASSLGFGDILVVDCHNAMGGHISSEDEGDLMAAAKECLEELKRRPQQEFEVGYANLQDLSSNEFGPAAELGQAGLAVMAVSVGGRKYAIGWADSNNMENTLRDKIIAASREVTMLEVCSSDTHSTSGKRTREGYFALGTASNHERIAAVFRAMGQKALSRAARAEFEVCSSQSSVKVMGKQQFEDYSKALDRSMNITKVFIGITFATYVAMLVMAA